MLTGDTLPDQLASQSQHCLQWVKLDRVGRGDKFIFVRYAPNSDRPRASHRIVTMCQQRTPAAHTGSEKLLNKPGDLPGS